MIIVDNQKYNFSLAGVIREQPHAAVISVPVLESKTVVLEKCFDKIFKDYDWKTSFSTSVFIMNDEVTSSEIVISLHTWLRRRCSNIENIYLFTTAHTGIAEWWKNWCSVNHQKSFQIVEMCYSNDTSFDMYFSHLINLPDIKFYYEHKNITKLFSFYGGTYSTPEREYLTLKMLQFKDSANIEFLAKFMPKQEILNYVEEITYFMNQNECNLISDMYDQNIDQNGFLKKSIQIFDQDQLAGLKNSVATFDDHHWHIDKTCWGSVIRETFNADCFSSVSEKTLRACLYHVALIPVGYNAVEGLENLGFWFPHDIMDYSYQSEKLYSDRIIKLSTALVNLNNTNSSAQLQQHYVDNIHNFQHNVNLVQEYIRKKNKLINTHDGKYYEKIVLHGIGKL